MRNGAMVCMHCGYPAKDDERPACPKCRGRLREVADANWMWRRVKWERNHKEDRAKQEATP